MSDALDVITCAIERSPWLSPRHIAEVVENDLVNANLLPDPDDEQAESDHTTTESINLYRIQASAVAAHQDWLTSDYFGCGTVSWYEGVAGGLGGDVGELCGQMTPEVVLALVAELREARATIARVTESLDASRNGAYPGVIQAHSKSHAAAIVVRHVRAAIKGGE